MYRHYFYSFASLSLASVFGLCEKLEFFLVNNYELLKVFTTENSRP